MIIWPCVFGSVTVPRGGNVWYSKHSPHGQEVKGKMRKGLGPIIPFKGMLKIT